MGRTVDNDLTKVTRRVFTAWPAAEGITTGSKPLQDAAWMKGKINNINKLDKRLWKTRAWKTL
jgi:hypothetical protein